ncbi:SDR family NAD(P)-dependent oxidoreductase [Prosthecodimorpha staleyi]|uniref:SDR family oxidoreductase n=1 Tax=Prosthecodimorpha staleyi TaxID=2840188 RepID=A0A947D7J5_9HYPH|nr:SDR family oxidoreductase [Prosthecodimorpha staleyi]MBT9290996.1 SDR family oxidoreductase [Prosthecodimorpha staleyi]
MSGRLAGRRILITGAASGIGRATAELFAAEGAALALIDRDAPPALETVATAVEPVLLGADVSDENSVQVAVAAAAAALGGLDGIVNAAGIFPVAKLEDTTLELWNRTLAVNLTGPFLVIRAALPHLKAARSATIVNVSSGSAIVPYPDLGAYGASKGGLAVASKVWAAELGPTIRVNVVAPGMTRTRMVTDWHPEPDRLADRAKALYALQRIAEPAEIAAAILFLTGDESSVVTGATLVADGGRTFH